MDADTAKQARLRALRDQLRAAERAWCEATLREWAANYAAGQAARDVNRLRRAVRRAKGVDR